MGVLHNKHQHGASMVHWLIALVPLLGFGALAIDMNNVYVSVGQLQNAADAGALEGARLLYKVDASNNLVIDTTANGTAQAVAEANLVQGSAPEVTVERGHWTFETSNVDAQGIERGGTFFPNASTADPVLVDADGEFRPWIDNDSSTDDLNNDTDVINAVRVIARRNVTPIQAFFGPLLGFSDYQAGATAVAYIGFAGGVDEFEFDMPIAMCDDIYDADKGCSVGRLVPEPGQTAGWTNLEATDQSSCSGAATAGELRDLVSRSKACPDGGGINDMPINFGEFIPVNNGQVETSFNKMHECWLETADGDDADDLPDTSPEWFLPVVNGCSFGGQCAEVIGGVRVEVLWMFDQNPVNSGSANIDNTAPVSMDAENNDGDTWSAAAEGIGTGAGTGIARWNSFVSHYQLEMDHAGTPATWDNGGAIQKTIYFRPSCEPVEIGGTGGPNYGVLADVPVLVR